MKNTIPGIRKNETRLETVGNAAAELLQRAIARRAKCAYCDQRWVRVKSGRSERSSPESDIMNITTRMDIFNGSSEIMLERELFLV